MDSTDSIPGIPKVGEKTATKILDEALAKDISYHSAVLEEYVKYFGFATGVARFAETFRLVYLLRTPEDVERELGIVLELPEINFITVTSNDW